MEIRECGERMTQLTEMGYTLVPNEFAELFGELGLQYATLADLLGYNKNTVKGWVTGRRIAPPFAIKEMQKLIDFMIDIRPDNN
jgi:DNA-binding transcriptional regulator YiaG